MPIAPPAYSPEQEAKWRAAGYVPPEEAKAAREAKWRVAGYLPPEELQAARAVKGQPALVQPQALPPHPAGGQPAALPPAAKPAGPIDWNVERQRIAWEVTDPVERDFLLEHVGRAEAEEKAPLPQLGGHPVDRGEVGKNEIKQIASKLGKAVGHDIDPELLTPGETTAISNALHDQLPALFRTDPQRAQEIDAALVEWDDATERLWESESRSEWMERKGRYLPHTKFHVSEEPRKNKPRNKNLEREHYDAATELLTNRGDRRAQLETLRGIPGDQHQFVVEAADELAEANKGAKRPGLYTRVTAGLALEGIAKAAQPIMELVGLGGTEKEIDTLRAIEGIGEAADPLVGPDAPWYEKALVGGARQALPMTIMIGGGSKARGFAKVRGWGEKVSKAAASAGFVGTMFPRAYRSTIGEMRDSGIDTNTLVAQTAAIGSAIVQGVIESAVEMPFAGTKGIALKKGLAHAVTEYAGRQTEKFVGEVAEEGLQRVTDKLGQVAVSHLQEEAPDQKWGDIIPEGVQAMSDSLLPLLGLMGAPGAVGAVKVAAEQRMAARQKKARPARDTKRLQGLEAKLDAGGEVSREDARALKRQGMLNVTGKERAERTQAVKDLFKEPSRKPPVEPGAEKPSADQVAEWIGVKPKPAAEEKPPVDAGKPSAIRDAIPEPLRPGYDALPKRIRDESPISQVVPSVASGEHEDTTVFYDKNTKTLRVMDANSKESAEELQNEVIASWAWDNLTPEEYAEWRKAVGRPESDDVRGGVGGGMSNVDSFAQSVIDWMNGKPWENSAPLLERLLGAEAPPQKSRGVKPKPAAKPAPPPPASDAGPATTGTKHAKTDELRSKAGLGERVMGEAESVEQWQTEASERIAADPHYAPRLAEELASKPRAIDRVEEAALNQHIRDLENRRIAGEDVRNEMLEAVKASEKVGTKWGQAGVSRQTELAADFSVAGLVRQHLRSANESPTDEQMAKYEEMADRIEKLEGEVKESAKREAGAEVERRIAEISTKRRETIESRFERQYATAADYGIDPKALRSAATEQAEAEAAVAREYNAAYRAVVTATGLTPAVIRDIENGVPLGEGERAVLAEYRGLDTKAPVLAREYPELGLQPEPADVEQTGDYAQALVEIIKRGPQRVPQWHDKLGEVAREMASERGPVADDFQFPWESEFGKDAFAPDAPRPKKGTKREKLHRKASDAVATFKDAWAGVLKAGASVATRPTSGGIDTEAVAALARATKAAAGVVRAYAELGVDSILEFTARLKRDIGDITDEQLKVFKDAWREGKVESPLGEKPEASEIGMRARELTEQAVESGLSTLITNRDGSTRVEGREDVVDAVHEQLSQEVPGISREDTALAMSQYGVFQPLNMADTKVKVRAIRGQLRETQKLEDLENAVVQANKWLEEGVDPNEVARRLRDQELLPKATGRQQVTKDTIQRQLAAEVSKRKKQLPVSVESQASQTARRKKALAKQLAFWEKRRDEAKQGKLPKKRQRTPEGKATLDDMLKVAKAKQEALDETEKVKRANRNLGQWIFVGLNEVTSLLPRALMLGLEASVFLRQAVFYAPGHPIRALGNLAQSMQAAFIERIALAQAEDIKDRVNARNGDYDVGDVQFTQKSGSEAVTTEEYQSGILRWLEESEGVVLSPFRAVAKGYMIAERGFRTFANTMKADMYDIFKNDTVRIREFFGRFGGQQKPWTETDTKTIGRSANIFSGRGTGLKSGNKLASWFFLARRWAWSRIQAEFIIPFQMVTPKFIGQWNADPAMRLAHVKMYAQALVGVATYMATRFWLNTLLAGDDDDKPTMEFNPLSSDFLKEKTGDTRRDTLGGMQQPFVLAARVLTGMTKTSKGEIKSLYGEDVKWGDGDVADAIIQFGRGKLGASPSGILDALSGKNLIGQTKTKADVVLDRLLPITYRDIWDAEKDLNLPQGTVAALEAFLGASVSTYGPKTTYRKANQEGRQKQFEKDLRQMQWDSPPPAYRESLTAEQMEQVEDRRKEKKRGVVYDATDAKPVRATKKSGSAGDKDYEQDLKTWEKNQEQFQQMKTAENVSYEKALDLLKWHLADAAGLRDEQAAVKKALEQNKGIAKRNKTLAKPKPLLPVPPITGTKPRLGSKGEPRGHLIKDRMTKTKGFEDMKTALKKLYGVK